MPVSTALTERPATAEDASAQSPSEPDPDAPLSGIRAVWPVLAMVLGLVVLAVAATIVIRSGDGPQPTPPVTPAATETAATDPLAITLSAQDVSVVTQVYGPGENSGWHSHSGIHAVAVLEGVLTVYDRQCQAQTFEPGRPYVGGQQPHLVRNETEAPVTMAVTYLNPPAPTSSTQRLSAPAGCTAS
jgi:quercetin dioxygenase-like cupin family protein